MIIEFGDPVDFAVPSADFPKDNRSIAPLARKARVKVFVLKSAYDLMIQHVNADKEIECGGVLVGYPFQDNQTQQIFVVIVGVIRDITDNRSIVHFTVTTETISRTRQIMEDKFPGLIAVGWYHSHPGHGVFLSGQDMTIVRGIYNEPWNLAWVIDPQRHQEGIFYGREGEPIIENIGSHSLFNEYSIWIPLQEYPECIRDLQSGELVHDDSRIEDLNVAPKESKATNREVEFTPRREQILSRRKMSWVLSLFIAMFVLTIAITGLSLFYSSWSVNALLLNDIVAILGIYILISDRKEGELTDVEFRRIVIMLFGIFCFLVIGVVTNYLMSSKLPSPIWPVPSQTVEQPTIFIEPSATATMTPPISLSPFDETKVPSNEIPYSANTR